MFRKDIYTASVERLWETTSWWYKKSWYISIWKQYRWHLKALTIKDWIDISNFWKEFRFNTEVDADIKESDKLIINWESYNVKWINKFDWITFSRLMCILQKW